MLSTRFLFLVSILLLTVGFILNFLIILPGYDVSAFAVEAFQDSGIAIYLSVNLICLGILPVLVGLFLMIIVYRRNARTPSDFFADYFSIILGILAVLWGLFQLYSAFFAYNRWLEKAAQFNVVSIESNLLTVYSTYWIMGFLWIAVGTLLIALRRSSIRFAYAPRGKAQIRQSASRKIS